MARKIFVGVRDQLESETLSLAEFSDENKAQDYYADQLSEYGGPEHEDRYDVIYAVAADREAFLRAYPIFGKGGGCSTCKPKDNAPKEE